MHMDCIHFTMWCNESFSWLIWQRIILSSLLRNHQNQASDFEFGNAKVEFLPTDVASPWKQWSMDMVTVLAALKYNLSTMNFINCVVFRVIAEMYQISKQILCTHNGRKTCTTKTCILFLVLYLKVQPFTWHNAREASYPTNCTQNNWLFQYVCT